MKIQNWQMFKRILNYAEIFDGGHMKNNKSKYMVAIAVLGFGIFAGAATTLLYVTTIGLFPTSTTLVGPGYSVVATSSTNLVGTGAIVVTPQNTDNGGDNTAGLQLALTNAAATGVNIEVMPGTYSLSSPLSCANVSLHANNVPDGGNRNTPSAVNFVARANGGFTGAAMLQMNGHCKIDGLAIYADGSGNFDTVQVQKHGNSIDHCGLYKGHYNVNFLGNPSSPYGDNFVTNSFLDSSVSDNVHVAPGSANGRISNNAINGAGSSGVGNGIYISAAQWFITENYLEQSLGSGIYVAGGQQLQISNNNIDANLQCGLTIAGPLQYSTIVGNLFVGSGFNQFYGLTGRAGASHICISGGPGNLAFGQNFYETQNKGTGSNYPDYVYVVTDSSTLRNTTFYEKAAGQNLGIYGNTTTQNLLTSMVH